MGWWKEQEEPEMILGDEPFDLTRRLLRDIAQLYQEEFGRQPTLAEFLRTLEVELGGSAHEFFSDCADQDIKKLTVKTAKRKKRQEFEVGDYFAIPVQDKVYAFGRLLADGPFGFLIVVLDQLDEMLKRPGELAEEKPLFYLYVTPDAWENWRWRILGGHEGYSAQGFKHPCFKMGDDQVGWRINCGPGTERPATTAEVAELERAELWPPERVGWRIAAEKGLVGIEDIQKMLARGQELYESGQYLEASKELGRAFQYAQWIRGNVKPDLLREQALHWLRLANNKLGYP
jgi:hypothetical protein